MNHVLSTDCHACLFFHVNAGVSRSVEFLLVTLSAPNKSVALRTAKVKPDVIIEYKCMNDPLPPSAAEVLYGCRAGAEAAAR